MIHYRITKQIRIAALCHLGLSLAILATTALAQSVGNCSSRIVVGSATTAAGDGGPAIKAQLLAPMGLAKDTAGNLYVADSGNNKVRVIRTDGTIQTVAGTGIAGSSGDGGLATAAQLNNPVAVAIGPDGAVYIVETSGNRVRKVSGDGTIHTVAGTGQGGFGGDGGPAIQARLTAPSAITFDARGDLYIADSGNFRVRRVSKDATISTFAGTGYALPLGPGDGVPAASGYLELPTDIAFRADGTLFIATIGQIKSVTPDGVMHTFAGAGGEKQPAEGLPAIQATLALRNLALDDQGNVIFAENDSTPEVIWKIDSGGLLHALVNAYTGAGMLVAPDGAITRATLVSNSILKYTSGSLSNNISPNVLIAGVSPHASFGDGGPGTSAGLANPDGIATDSAGNLFIADSWAGAIRRLDTKGIITTVAGSAGTTPTPDGLPALQTTVDYPTALAISRSGEIYYSEEFRYRVRKIGNNGLVTTVAGDGAFPFPFSNYDGRDGKKASTVSVNADALAVDGNGVLYIADSLSMVLWCVTADGILHKVDSYRSSPVPVALATDPGGKVYYLQSNSTYSLNVLRAENGSPSQVVRDIGDFFSNPSGFAIDAAGILYLTDGPVLSKVFPDGAVSVLTNTNTHGPAVGSVSVTLDAAGNLFAADAQARIAEVPGATTCTASVFPRIARQGSVSAASYVPSWVTPGEIVSISGIAVGPSQPARGIVDASNKLTTKIGETQVLFDGIPAPMLSASSGQSVAIVPFGVAGQLITTLQISVNGFLSNSAQMQIEDSMPGIFTQNASGSGPGAILNEDYSINSAANPAKKGSVVMVYATGLGLLTPPVPDGTITGSALSSQAQRVTALVDGQQADVLYAGTAPGLVAGASQINVQIPPNSRSGAVSVTIAPISGIESSQGNVTVAVQ